MSAERRVSFASCPGLLGLGVYGWPPNRSRVLHTAWGESNVQDSRARGWVLSFQGSVLSGFMF